MRSFGSPASGERTKSPHRRTENEIRTDQGNHRRATEQLVATPGALTALEKAGQNAMEFLSRHVTGDWGDIPEEDRKENQYSLEHGFRLLSSYRTNADQVVWVITEGSRSHTTLLLPDEY